MKLKNRIFARFLDDGEKVLHVAHRHISIFMYKSSKVFFFGIVIPIVLYFIFPNLLIGWAIWGGVGLFGVIYHFLDWYFDVWLLTNMGIIDIERNGFFDISTTKVEYHMLEGVSYTIKGFWRTIFNFGEVTIDKLGGKTSIVLEDATRPKKLESKVLKFQDKYILDRSVRDHQTLKSMLSEMIAYHTQNKKIDKE